MTLYWCIRDVRPKRIGLVTAESESAARQALGAQNVYECFTPALVRQARPAGEVWEATVDRMPSIYDQFDRGGGTMDHEGMDDAGFDVS